MKTAVFAVSALALAAGAAIARPPMSVSTSAITNGDDIVLRGPGNQFFDFEAPAYALGAIEPQNGWSASGVNLPYASVSNVNPAGGQQHLRIAFDSSVAAGISRNVLGPNSGALPVGPSSVSFDFAISGLGGANYRAIGQAPSQGFLSWRVEFDFEFGDIYVLDDLGLGLQFVDTGSDFTPGTYMNMRVETDPGADSIRYFLDNNLIYTGVAGVFAGTTVEQMVFASDNFQLEGETGDFDNVSVTPAPGALALLGLGGLAAARRRRN